MKFGLAGPERWCDARDLLLPALEWDGDQDEAYAVAQISAGLAQLWISEDSQVRGAAITCLSRTAKGLVCEIWLMGGIDRAGWLHFLPVIEDQARGWGCVRMTLTGRKGWERLLPEYGLKAVILEKGL